MRLQDKTSEAAFYLYKDIQDADTGVNDGATGCLVSVTDDEGNYKKVFAATNTHVIAQGCTVLRFNKIGSGIAIADTLDSDWIRHPDGDDICLCQIFPNSRFKFDEPEFQMSPAIRDSKDLLSIAKAEEYGVGIGDEVHMISRHPGIEGTARNCPIIRFGNISRMETDEGVLNPHTGIKQSSIICEMRSTGGYSGSPVNVVIDRSVPREKKLPAGEGYGHRHFMLGISWGHIESVCSVQDKSDNTRDTGLFTTVSSNLACVVPAWKILDIIQLEEKV